MTERKLPNDPVLFIRDCIRSGRMLWTYHVNMRLEGRFIDRNMIIEAAETYEMIEEYPKDKYFPSYLLLGKRGEDRFHVLFGTDVDGQNVRIITAYYPSREEWEQDFKTRRV